MLYLLYIDDINNAITSQIKLDDGVPYRNVKSNLMMVFCIETSIIK